MMRETLYEYKDAAGAVIGVITRIDDDDGKKTFRASPGFPNPRPLYNLDLLAARTSEPVLVVEGEKTAEAAAKLFPNYVVVTSPFGAKSADKADWSPLASRDVVVWPDNDPAGGKYCAAVCWRVRHARIVTPKGFPDRWDLADVVPPGADIEKALSEAKPLIIGAKDKVVQFPDKKNGAAAMLKATAEAVGKPVDDSIVSPPGEPMPNVRRFLAAKYAHPERRLLVQQGGQFYCWDGTCWPAVRNTPKP